MTNDHLSKRPLRLSELAPDEWFSDRRNSSFWLRIYTSLMHAHDKFIPALKGAIKKLSLDRQVAIEYAVVEGLKVLQFLQNMYAGEDGKTVVNFNANQKELEKSNYIFILTPMRVDGKAGKESDARTRLEIVAGVIRAHTGTNFMRDIVFEAEVEAGFDQYNAPSSGIHLPQMQEGPFVNKNNWEHIEQIIDKLQVLQTEKRARVELALEFFSKALQEEDSFFHYWTALEILCNGTAQRIRERLKSCYSLKSLKDLGDATGFNQIAKWRHDFFHKGIKPKMSADTERYIQLLFLDLLRQEVNLPLAGHLAGIQQWKGYNLSELGLPDNRTEEQKESERKTKEAIAEQLEEGGN